MCRISLCFNRTLRYLMVWVSLIFLIFIIGRDVYGMEEESQTITKNIYHRHTGSTRGGGCYGSSNTGYHEVRIPCGGTMVYYPQTDTTGCDRCGAGYHGNQSGRGCWKETLTHTPYSYYSINCGRTRQVVGTLTLSKSTQEWTKELSLVGSFTNSSMSVGTKPYVWNGVASEEGIYRVTANGNYSLSLVVDENSDVGSLIMRVNNIDNNGPSLEGYIIEPNEWTSDSVRVILGDCLDLQEDGSEGSGITNTPYSYDGGITWVTSNEYSYSENGRYEVKTIDKLGNVGIDYIEIKNIDNIIPKIDIRISDSANNILTTEIIVEANDIQPDGSEGAGLAQEAYSYDGGNTWSDNNKVLVKANGTYSVQVRDRLGNIASKEIVINNLDTDPPIAKLISSKKYMNKGDIARLSIIASDQGSGLHELPYSYDGITWTDISSIEISEANVYNAWVRDALGNVTIVTLRIMETSSHGNTNSGESSGYDNSNISEDKIITQVINKLVEEKDIGYSINAEYTNTSMDTGIYRGAYHIADIFNNSYIYCDDIYNKEELLDNKVESDAIEESHDDKLSLIGELPYPLNIPLVRKVALATIVLMVLSIVLWVLYVLYRSAGIYNLIGDDEYVYMGREYINREQDYYKLKMPKRFIERSVSKEYKICPGKLFGIMQKGKDMVVYGLKNERAHVAISNNMEVVIM